MKKFLFLFGCSVCIMNFIAAQNVGIGTITPTEKLHVDSGNIKIGKLVWSGVNIPFLKFGDGDYVTLGEEEADDRLTIRAKELFIRPSNGYNTVPLSIQGTTNYSHFFFGTNEDTYIRAGKNGSNVIINDITGGKVGIGMGNPTRAGLEQYGAVGTTAAIFGGEGSGVSLQRNWPAIGLNHWYDGSVSRSIGPGYSAQLGVDQTNGAVFISNFTINSTSANQDLGSGTTRVYVKSGRLGIRNNNPVSDIDIVQLEGDLNSFTGIRFNGYGAYWNILTTGPNPNEWFEFALNGLVRSYIRGDGEYIQISDSNYKKNITSFDNQGTLNQIINLRPVHYTLKNSGNDNLKSLGFLSQEVEKVFPELISDNKGVKMMNYTGLIPILTKGMQEQQQQIEILQKENANLKARMDRLEKLLLKP